MDSDVDQQRFQQWVVKVCQELGLPLAEADDDFFRAGGNSLTAAQLIERAEEEFGEDSLPPEDLFTGSSVREMAATLRRTTARDGA
jgi:hypothetical protein